MFPNAMCFFIDLTSKGNKLAGPMKEVPSDKGSQFDQPMKEVLENASMFIEWSISLTIFLIGT